MDETVILPSPNWFLVSAFGVAPDGWIAYGGPSKSLCILEPVKQDRKGVIQTNVRYQAHVVNRANAERTISIDFSPEWMEKKLLLTGSADGAVKQWSVECINQKVLIKSTHNHDIHKNDKEEVIGVGYSSESFAITVGSFGKIVKWDLEMNIVSSYSQFLKTFRPTCMSCSKHLPLHIAVGTKQGVVLVIDMNNKGKVVYKVRAQDDEILNVSWCPKYEVLLKKSINEPLKKHKSNISKRLERPPPTELDDEPKTEEAHNNTLEEDLNNLAIAKDLPEDSFDETIVEEDSMFDIYKDHEADEFGHKKFEPKDIVVKVKEERETDNFLAECLKLKEDILKTKDESSITNLVEALDKAHFGENSKSENNNDDKTEDEVISSHLHKHLLATIGKFGGLKIWSKTGKLVSSCIVPCINNKNPRNKSAYSCAILWYKADMLLVGDGKAQLCEINPLLMDCKNKLTWRPVQALHRRGLFCIASNAPRLQSDLSSDASQDWLVYTVAQDRNICVYSMEKRQEIATYNTCGGFLYTMQACPYDAKKIAVSVGDGAVRVWETEFIEDEGKLALGNVTACWQNVQGKVLNVAWHPTRENLLAFSTGEARIGLLDIGRKIERPARTLPIALRGAIYSICWGENFDLYAIGGGELVLYKTDKPEREPVTIKVELDGVTWQVTDVLWHARGLLCGNDCGAVALLSHTHQIITQAFPFKKLIHNMECHPQTTSSCTEDSQYKDMIAVTSADKNNNVVILEYDDKGESPKLNTWKVLSGHEMTVLEVAWNPHREELLLSSSQDTTVRVWDIAQGACISIFGNHVQSSMGAMWSAFPQLASTVLSGGADCCLRVWDYEDHPASAYAAIHHVTVPRRQKKKNKERENAEQKAEEEKKEDVNPATLIVPSVVNKKKCAKKFLLPCLQRQMNVSIQTVRRMVKRYIEANNEGKLSSDLKLQTGAEKVSSDEEQIPRNDGQMTSDDESDGNEEKDEEYVEMDMTKIFGNTNEFNEVIDLEMQKHLEHGRNEQWMMMCMLRGHIDAMIQFAHNKDALCPFLVSLAPCVSYKYWKDVTQMYLAQIERLYAKNELERVEYKQYGGVIYRRVALYLSLHDVTRAVRTLLDARLYKEAYVLSRARHMDSIAEDILRSWVGECVHSGSYELAVVCYLALGNVNKAIQTLTNIKDPEYLQVAAELAKCTGQNTFASHIEEISTKMQTDTEVEDLKPLPSKLDAMKQNIDHNGVNKENGDGHSSDHSFFL